MTKRSKLRKEGNNGGARNDGGGNGNLRAGGVASDEGTVFKQLRHLSLDAGSEESLSLDVLQQVWARRADQFAAVPVDDDVGERLNLTIVRLGHELYGLEARYVFRIHMATHITRVPRVPEWVMGVTNERGRILSVVDLYRFFEFTRSGPDYESNVSQQYLVIVETLEMELALLADEVLDIESVPLRQLREISEAIRGIPQEYVRGVLDQKTTDLHNGGGEALIVVLDLPVLLADERLIIHEEVI